MKKMTIICTMLCFGLLFSSCNKDNPGEKGLLEFKTLNPMASSTKMAALLKSTSTNPPLTGDTTKTYPTGLNFCIGDVWVSQGEVKAGEPDNLEWIRLTTITNKDIKPFEDYSFAATEIPVGSYNSIKITFRNIWYRPLQLVSDPSVNYELLESMGSWTTPCDENDTTWAPTSYFGPDGNHRLNDSDLFELASAGEKIGGFNIEADKKSIVTWRLGAGYTGTCYTYLIDENSNLEWDCGVDRMEFECVPIEEYMYMWDFVVEYE